MKQQTRLLLLVACVVVAAAALLASHGVAIAVADAAPMHDLLLSDAAVRVEDDVMGHAEMEEAAAYPRRRALYGSEYINYNTLAASKLGCYGQCGARGRPYTGRGCQSYFQCRG